MSALHFNVSFFISKKKLNVRYKGYFKAAYREKTIHDPENVILENHLFAFTTE